MVLAAVRTFGTQWGAVSGQLVGRTADAVRNRWHRLQKRGLADASEEAVPCRQLLAAAAIAGDRPVIWPEPTADAQTPSQNEPCSGAAPTASTGLSGAASRAEPQPAFLPTSGEVVCLTGSDHGRARWTAHEDQVIQEGVHRWGCKWRQISAMLPGRSDSSIRNRWMRLLKATSGIDDSPDQPGNILSGGEGTVGPGKLLDRAPSTEPNSGGSEATVEPDTALILVAFAQSR